MAILRVSYELLDEQPTLLNVLKSYFDKMVEMIPDEIDMKKYEVQKEGLPKDSTSVRCTCKKNEFGNIEVISCK